MERPETENDGSCGRRRLAKNRAGLLCAPPRMLAVGAPAPAVKEVKLAAVAAELNVRLRSADMPAAMQERAIRHARALIDANPEKKGPNPTHLAMRLKKEFDAMYGPAWHCIAGKSFGSFVTHSTGGFLYFSVDKLSFLLFKTEVRPVMKSPLPLPKFNNNSVKSSQ